MCVTFASITLGRAIPPPMASFSLTSHFPSIDIVRAFISDETGPNQIAVTVLLCVKSKIKHHENSQQMPQERSNESSLKSHNIMINISKTKVMVEA